jgi:hypothetical protein
LYIGENKLAGRLIVEAGDLTAHRHRIGEEVQKAVKEAKLYLLENHVLSIIDYRL